MTVFFDNFHFLRPYWLLTLVPVGMIWLAMRRNDMPSRQFREFIAPHLLQHLLHSPSEGRQFLRPARVLLMLWLLIITALAGPSWQVQPSPFAEQKAGLMILLKLSPSMNTEDLHPSRLERARHKMHDLFGLRSDGPTGLIAYSGSAHLVMPLTPDTRIIEQMAGALEPEIMPTEGDVLADALALAAEQFSRRKATGSILVIADSVDPLQIQALSDFRKSAGFPVQILAAVGSRELMVQNGIEAGAGALGARVHEMTVDDRDVNRLAQGAESDVSQAAADMEQMQWKDSGYLLVPLIFLGTLLWARRGWSLRWE
jgi:Ca-activated chloride channel family protein